MCLKTCAPYFDDNVNPPGSTMPPAIKCKSKLGLCGPGKYYFQSGQLYLVKLYINYCINELP